ncbi:hypothetical protein QCA50_020077 [Cerrena zonata]|uniref:SUI1 domain-containing protein n=1 Tax=Cerrena zonata TaxID=2478898 RepID=A0AAW0FFS0_9APHY
MFKKPLADLKTTAPIRTSERRKLRLRVIETYSLPVELGDLLVPEGLLSQKFSTHVDEHGVAYLSPEGDPLWFTIGKGSDDMIPTVYTLWKHQDLLPFLSTPSAVVPKLVGGADLMIPGVIQHSPNLQPNQLVSITQYHQFPKLGPPLAVGRMAVNSEALDRSDQGDDVKGKAVVVLHTWKDHLWDLGKKGDAPEPRVITASDVEETHNDTAGTPDVATSENAPASSSGAQVHSNDDGSEPSSSTLAVLTPEDVSHCLRNALLQAIQDTLSTLPPSSFPIPASTFWSTYVLPARPAFAVGTNGLADASGMDIKHSTHKSVKNFLKASAKEGLLKLKESKGDVLITAVYATHPAVLGHKSHGTVQNAEAKREKAEERERKEKEAEEKKKGEIELIELWKPFGTTVPWFVAAEKDTSVMYTAQDIKEIFNDYVSSKQLVNTQEQQYINVGEDTTLLSAVSSKNGNPPEFLKREETLKRIKDHMQSWHEVRVDGKDPVRKKGPVKPISVIVKLRQGRKAATLITGFESYFLKAEEIAEELRKLCASSTAVTPLPGKANELEIMVQGKQLKAVTNLLVSKGIPEKWIECSDQSHAKKKK